MKLVMIFFVGWICYVIDQQGKVHSVWISTRVPVSVGGFASLIEVSVNEFCCLCFTHIHQKEQHQAIHGPTTSMSQFTFTTLPAIISFQTVASGTCGIPRTMYESLTTCEVFQRPHRSMSSTKWPLSKCHLLTLRSPWRKVEPPEKTIWIILSSVKRSLKGSITIVRSYVIWRKDMYTHLKLVWHGKNRARD